MKNEKLYCIHGSDCVYGSDNLMHPDFYLYSANDAFKSTGSWFVKEVLKEKKSYKVYHHNLSDGRKKPTKIDEGKYFIFSDDFDFLKQQVREEIKNQISILNNSIKELEKIDVENLPMFSREQILERYKD